MADSQKGIDPVAYLTYGENAQLRASATTRLQALREDRVGAVENARIAYRQKEKELLEAVLEWKQAEDTDRSERALHVGRLQKELSSLDMERRNIEYSHRFLQQIYQPAVYLGKQLRFSVADRTIPL